MDSERLIKLLRLAHKNENYSERRAALKQAERISRKADVALYGRIRLARQGSMHEVDNHLSRLLRELEDVLRENKRVNSVLDGVRRWRPTEAETNERWIPGTVAENPNGYGWRVRGMSPGFYTPLMHEDAAMTWAAAWNRTGNGCFATAWAEPEDGAHLRPAPPLIAGCEVG